MSVQRRDYKRVAQETLTALRRGYYSTDEGVRRMLAPSDRVRDAPAKALVHADTRTLLAPVPAAKGVPKGKDTCDLTLFVGGSFEAAQWLLSAAASLNRQLQTPAVLDFASDSNPGGGFHGSQQGTQEEELCRQSNLGVCLEELYDRVGGARYMPRHGAVYVPDVVVFRGKNCVFLDEPYWVSVIASSLRNGDADDPQLLREKVAGVFSVAARHGHRTVVLGAWGCGAFGNATQLVASAFRDCLLSAQCLNRFDNVVLALPKKQSENFNTFRAVMPEAGVVNLLAVTPSATDEEWRHAPWSYYMEPELEPKLEPQPKPEQSLAELVRRCKSLYTQLSHQSVGSATRTGLAQLDQAVDAALLASGGRQPFATMCKGWLALQHGQPDVAEATLERGLVQLRRSGKSSKTASEMERLLALAHDMNMQDSGSKLVRTLSARERACAAAAVVVEQDAHSAERGLRAELAMVNQQVRKLVLDCAEDGGCARAASDDLVALVRTCSAEARVLQAQAEQQVIAEQCEHAPMEAKTTAVQLQIETLHAEIIVAATQTVGQPLQRARPKPGPEPGLALDDQQDHRVLKFDSELYADAVEHWPQRGQHILAQFNDEAILVYQAFSEDIGRYAVAHQGFAGCKQYSCTRMTWIKTNFLWMMYRSKWASRHNQQMVLGVWVKRSFFEQVLRSAKSTQPGSVGHSEQSKNTPCRLQWDPDHLPNGDPHVSRRAIQIGIKGPLADQYASEDKTVSPILGIVDVASFVKQQKRLLDGMKRSAKAQPAGSELMVAREWVYTELPDGLAQGIGLASQSE